MPDLEPFSGAPGAAIAAAATVLKDVTQKASDSSDVQCDIDFGDTAWVLVCFLLVLTMMPALALFEAGLLRSKNTLSIITQVITGIVVNSVLYYVIGYSLIYGPSQGGFIGGVNHFLLYGVPVDKCSRHAPSVPAAAFAMFEMMFAAITPLLMTGAYAERLTFKAFMILTVLWEILIYYPLAHWVFVDDGWLAKMGALDFAGGIVIHTSAGASSIVAALMLGPREGFDDFDGEFPPHNIPLAAIGTALLWMGWFGFNAGSALAADQVATSAVMSTQIACSMCALTFLLLFWKKHKPTSVSMMNGTIAGLAGITPACGYIYPQTALAFGVILGLSAYGGVHLIKETLRIDDALDVSSVHGITGAVGSILIGFFASKHINPAGHNGVFYGGGGKLLGVQLLAVLVAAVFAATMTYLIFLFIIKLGIPIRVGVVEELKGLDMSEHGETAYHDLVVDVNELKSMLPKHWKASFRSPMTSPRLSPRKSENTLRTRLLPIPDEEGSMHISDMPSPDTR